MRLSGTSEEGLERAEAGVEELLGRVKQAYADWCVGRGVPVVAKEADGVY